MDPGDAVARVEYFEFEPGSADAETELAALIRDYCYPSGKLSEGRLAACTGVNDYLWETVAEIPPEAFVAQKQNWREHEDVDVFRTVGNPFAVFVVGREGANDLPLVIALCFGLRHDGRFRIYHDSGAHDYDEDDLWSEVVRPRVVRTM